MKALVQSERSDQNRGDCASFDACHVDESDPDARSRSGTGLLELVFSLYRLLISPLFGQTCRFEPSCSHFVEESIARYGVIRGLRIGLARLLRCHPFHSGGYDPVP